MNTLRRSPRITSGVAIWKSHASKSIARVMAIPATRPAERPQSVALDRLIIIATMGRRGACAKRLLYTSDVARRSGPGTLTAGLCSRESDFQKCRQDPKTGDERAPQCSGNFRYPTLATSMINGHFENAQACSGRFHLHLQIPTVGFFAHS